MAPNHETQLRSKYGTRDLLAQIEIRELVGHAWANFLWRHVSNVPA
jgi:hypothetical protein